jgi:DUF4097 and DUF4098 domain-containing protein YvlB
VDVDLGSIEVNATDASEVVVDVLRKVTRGDKADEEEFLRERPVTFSQEGDTITVQSRGKTRSNWSWSGRQRTEASYRISVPARFNTQLKTSGGSIAVNGLTGEVKAGTSGGGLKFTRLHGPLDGGTSGGSIRIDDCEGTLKVKTSGGKIEVSGGSGSLDSQTSGGSIKVKEFRGPVQAKTSGGGVAIENAVGNLEGSTSGGSISATFASPPEEVTLKTSGGGITLRVPAESAFDLDASTSGGSVKSELPVATDNKPVRGHLKGPVNGGGKPVVLRTSGGSIRVQKL